MTPPLDRVERTTGRMSQERVIAWLRETAAACSSAADMLESIAPSRSPLTDVDRAARLLQTNGRAYQFHPLCHAMGLPGGERRTALRTALESDPRFTRNRGWWTLTHEAQHDRTTPVGTP